MSNIFISHSSIDKPFVRKLATALLAEGFPVWLDTWKMSLGDSLLKGVYSGIEESSMVLLVVSRNAIESGWVNRELDAALAIEEKTKRKFLIPIKIDDCEGPLKVADRLYADFSCSFAEPFSRVSDHLRSHGGDRLTVDPRKELISLSFRREVDIDIFSLKQNWKHIVERQGENFELAGSQIVVNEDEECETLLRRLHERIDRIGEDKYYSPELEQTLKYDLNSVRNFYRYLTDGVALMLSHQLNEEAIFWFAKLLKAKISYALWGAQSPGKDVLDYGRKWRCADLGSQDTAVEFFSANEIESIILYTERGLDDGHYFYLWIDKEEAHGLRNAEGLYDGPSRFRDACTDAAGNKYVYPQMIFKYLRSGRGGAEAIWNLDEAMVGTP
jgi:hypothetical protein